MLQPIVLLKTQFQAFFKPVNTMSVTRSSNPQGGGFVFKQSCLSGLPSRWASGNAAELVRSIYALSWSIMFAVDQGRRVENDQCKPVANNDHVQCPNIRASLRIVNAYCIYMSVGPKPTSGAVT